jgi:hypothetical protein
MRTALALLLVLLALCGQIQAAHYPLEIIQPQEGLDTQNRFYKAYSGLEYKVNVAVIGGAWPSRFELVRAPAGMTIDADKGIITWPSPVAAGSPHEVSVKVVDKEGASDTHTWTIAVTTQGFLFLDAVNGKTRAQGGSGTIDNPFKTISDYYSIKTTPESYNAKYETTYPNHLVYYKSGVYDVPDWDKHGNLPMLHDKKPYVHLAFPGHKPVIDYAVSHFNHHDGRATNLYWDGFEHRAITNPARHAFTVGDGDGAVFVNNTFHGMTYKPGSHNQSCIMFVACPMRKYMALIDNEFYDLDHGYCVLSYHTEKCVFERNHAHDIHTTAEAHHCIGLKVSSPRWFIRNNRFVNLTGNTDAIWLYFSDHYRIDVPCEQVEASYNLVLNQGGGTTLTLGGHGHHYGEVWIFRNTLVGSIVDVWVNTPTDRPVRIYDNVIVNPFIRPDSLVRIRTRDNGTPDRVQIRNNLVGVASDKIVDAEGRLTKAYTKHLGIKGCQLGESRPVSPSPRRE